MCPSYDFESKSGIDFRMLEENMYMQTILRELASIGEGAGYLKCGIPHIPKLAEYKHDVTDNVMRAIMTQHPEDLDANPLLLPVWSCLAGIGAAMLWNLDWGKLKKNGIYSTLTRERGIFAMDEYVLDLIGMPFEGDEAKKLISHLYKASSSAVKHIKGEPGSLQLRFTFSQTLEVMYLYGIGLQINRIRMA